MSNFRFARLLAATDQPEVIFWLPPTGANRKVQDEHANSHFSFRLWLCNKSNRIELNFRQTQFYSSSWMKFDPFIHFICSNLLKFHFIVLIYFISIVHLQCHFITKPSWLHWILFYSIWFYLWFNETLLWPPQNEPYALWSTSTSSRRNSIRVEVYLSWGDTSSQLASYFVTSGQQVRAARWRPSSATCGRRLLEL